MHLLSQLKLIRLIYYHVKIIESINKSKMYRRSFINAISKNFYGRRNPMEMSDFCMGTILGKGFVQALVHNVNSTRAFGTRAINSMHLCLSKTLSQDCPHGEIRHF